MSVPRIEPPYSGSEREQANAFLDYYRETMAVKADGLSEADARRSLLPSKLMTAAGIIRHLTWVECYWFEVILDQRPGADKALYTPGVPDSEFLIPDDMTLADVVADYRRQCEISRAITARMDSEDTAPRRGDHVTVRWVLLHMIEETARHAGHLDLIRELIDGVTGD